MLELVTGPPSSATITDFVANALRVRVVDDQGAPVAGVLVSVGIGGGGLLTNQTDTTDGRGEVATSLTVGPVPGSVALTVTATAPDNTTVTGSPMVVTFVADDVNEGDIFTLVNLNRVINNVEPPVGTPSLATPMNLPTHVAVSDDRRVAVNDTNAHHVLVFQDGILTQKIGTEPNGAPNAGDGNPAINATLAGPSWLVYLADGNLVIGEQQAGRIRLVDTNGIISTIAGGGTVSGASANGADPTDLLLTAIDSMTVTPDGSTLWVHNAASANHYLYRVDLVGDVEEAVNTNAPLPCRFGGTASFPTWWSMAIDASGDVLFAASSVSSSCGVAYQNRVWRYSHLSGEVQPSTVRADAGLAVRGDRYVAVDSYSHVIRTGTVHGGPRVVAGSEDNPGDDGDRGPADQATFFFPEGAATDDDGNVYVVDSFNRAVRVIRGALSATPPNVSSPSLRATIRRSCRRARWSRRSGSGSW